MQSLQMDGDDQEKEADIPTRTNVKTTCDMSSPDISAAKTEEIKQLEQETAINQFPVYAASWRTTWRQSKIDPVFKFAPCILPCLERLAFVVDVLLRYIVHPGTPKEVVRQICFKLLDALPFLLVHVLGTYLVNTEGDALVAALDRVRAKAGDAIARLIEDKLKLHIEQNLAPEIRGEYPSSFEIPLGPRHLRTRLYEALEARNAVALSKEITRPPTSTIANTNENLVPICDAHLTPTELEVRSRNPKKENEYAWYGLPGFSPQTTQNMSAADLEAIANINAAYFPATPLEVSLADRVHAPRARALRIITRMLTTFRSMPTDVVPAEVREMFTPALTLAAVEPVGVGKPQTLGSAFVRHPPLKDALLETEFRNSLSCTTEPLGELGNAQEIAHEQPNHVLRRPSLRANFGMPSNETSTYAGKMLKLSERSQLTMTSSNPIRSLLTAVSRLATLEATALMHQEQILQRSAFVRTTPSPEVIWTQHDPASVIKFAAKSPYLEKLIEFSVAYERTVNLPWILWTLPKVTLGQSPDPRMLLYAADATSLRADQAEVARMTQQYERLIEHELHTLFATYAKSRVISALQLEMARDIVLNAVSQVPRPNPFSFEEVNQVGDTGGVLSHTQVSEPESMQRQLTPEPKLPSIASHAQTETEGLPPLITPSFSPLIGQVVSGLPLDDVSMPSLSPICRNGVDTSDDAAAGTESDATEARTAVFDFRERLVQSLTPLVPVADALTATGATAKMAAPKHFKGFKGVKFSDLPGVKILSSARGVLPCATTETSQKLTSPAMPRAWWDPAIESRDVQALLTASITQPQPITPNLNVWRAPVIARRHLSLIRYAAWRSAASPPLLDARQGSPQSNAKHENGLSDSDEVALLPTHLTPLIEPLEGSELQMRYSAMWKEREQAVNQALADLDLRSNSAMYSGRFAVQISQSETGNAPDERSGTCPTLRFAWARDGFDYITACAQLYIDEGQFAPKLASRLIRSALNGDTHVRDSLSSSQDRQDYVVSSGLLCVPRTPLLNSSGHLIDPRPRLRYVPAVLVDAATRCLIPYTHRDKVWNLLQESIALAAARIDKAFERTVVETLVSPTPVALAAFANGPCGSSAKTHASTVELILDEGSQAGRGPERDVYAPVRQPLSKLLQSLADAKKKLGEPTTPESAGQPSEPSETSEAHQPDSQRNGASGPQESPVTSRELAPEPGKRIHAVYSETTTRATQEIKVSSHISLQPARPDQQPYLTSGPVTTRRKQPYLVLRTFRPQELRQGVLSHQNEFKGDCKLNSDDHRRFIVAEKPLPTAKLVAIETQRQTAQLMLANRPDVYSLQRDERDMLGEDPLIDLALTAAGVAPISQPDPSHRVRAETNPSDEERQILVATDENDDSKWPPESEVAYVCEDVRLGLFADGIRAREKEQHIQRMELELEITAVWVAPLNNGLKGPAVARRPILVSGYQTEAPLSLLVSLDSDIHRLCLAMVNSKQVSEPVALLDISLLFLGLARNQNYTFIPPTLRVRVQEETCSVALLLEWNEHRQQSDALCSKIMREIAEKESTKFVIVWLQFPSIFNARQFAASVMEAMYAAEECSTNRLLKPENRPRSTDVICLDHDLSSASLLGDERALLLAMLEAMWEQLPGLANFAPERLYTRRAFVPLYRRRMLLTLVQDGVYESGLAMGSAEPMRTTQQEQQETSNDLSPVRSATIDSSIFTSAYGYYLWRPLTEPSPLTPYQRVCIDYEEVCDEQPETRKEEPLAESTLTSSTTEAEAQEPNSTSTTYDDSSHSTELGVSEESLNLVYTAGSSSPPTIASAMAAPAVVVRGLGKGLQSNADLREKVTLRDLVLAGPARKGLEIDALNFTCVGTSIILLDLTSQSVWAEIALQYAPPTLLAYHTLGSLLEPDANVRATLFNASMLASARTEISNSPLINLNMGMSVEATDAKDESPSSAASEATSSSSRGTFLMDSVYLRESRAAKADDMDANKDRASLLMQFSQQISTAVSTRVQPSQYVARIRFTGEANQGALGYPGPWRHAVEETSAEISKMAENWHAGAVTKASRESSEIDYSLAHSNLSQIIPSRPYATAESTNTKGGKEASTSIEAEKLTPSLLIPVPNQIRGVGTGRERLLLNTAELVNTRELQMLGILTGFSLRSSTLLAIDLSPKIWASMLCRDCAADGGAGSWLTTWRNLWSSRIPHKMTKLSDPVSILPPYQPLRPVGGLRQDGLEGYGVTWYEDDAELLQRVGLQPVCRRPLMRIPTRSQESAGNYVHTIAVLWEVHSVDEPETHANTDDLQDSIAELGGEDEYGLHPTLADSAKDADNSTAAIQVPAGQEDNAEGGQLQVLISQKPAKFCSVAIPKCLTAREIRYIRLSPSLQASLRALATYDLRLAEQILFSAQTSNVIAAAHAVSHLPPYFQVVRRSVYSPMSFAANYDLTHSVVLSDGIRVREFGLGGAHRPLRYAERALYAYAVLRAKRKESAPLVAVMRDGLRTTIPSLYTCSFNAANDRTAFAPYGQWLSLGASLLDDRGTFALLSPAELENMVVGESELDLALLKSRTEIGGQHADDQFKEWFWRALESFNSAERSKFLQFAWGVSRLPKSFATSGMKLVVNVNQPSSHLPTSHTCFMSIDCPRYSSYETLREKLLTAIYCNEINS